MGIAGFSSLTLKVTGVTLVAGLLSSTPTYAALSLLEAAAGGGGAGYAGGTPGDAGQVTTSGDNGGGPGGGAGGVAGLGGAGGTGDDGNFNGGGGAGFLGNGGDGVGSGPFVEGGSGDGGLGPPTFAGGLGGNVAGGPANGGFGGGCGGGWQGGGGGGGYSGGGGGDGITAGGGGGGSYVSPSGTLVTATAGVNGVANGSGGAGANGEVEIGSVVFSYTGSIQNYIIPTTGVYEIQAWGAQGGSGATSGDIGGYGAYVDALFDLTAGTDLEIVVGGAGLTGDFDGFFAGGGGGGSFVYTGVIPEPSTWVLMAVGFAGLAFASYRKTHGRLAPAKA
jgi:Glycine rich protein/PEP-CTERM motif